MDNKSFYKTAKWKHLREVILRRDGYECQLSKRYGKHLPAKDVHHIFPLEEFPEYSYSPWNLISLTASKHLEMHTQSGELSDAGIELLRRTARKYGKDIPLRYSPHN